MAKQKRNEVLRQAWIGDAVLCLYARCRILREDGAIDEQKAQRLTSNQFLSGFAEPSETEAAIGRAFEQQGLAGAFEWIECNLVPLFDRHEAKRHKGVDPRQPRSAGPAREGPSD